MTTDALVTEITPEMHRRNSQIGVYTLAREAFWHGFDSILTDLVGKCEDLSKRYHPHLWEQFAEGLITASEFLNKLIDEMSHTDGNAMPPIDRLAAEALHRRADMACRKFAKSVAPINAQLEDQAGKEGDIWFNRWTAQSAPYLFCSAIGSRLCDLDRDNKT